MQQGGYGGQQGGRGFSQPMQQLPPPSFAQQQMQQQNEPSPEIQDAMPQILQDYRKQQDQRQQEQELEYDPWFQSVKHQNAEGSLERPKYVEPYMMNLLQRQQGGQAQQMAAMGQGAAGLAQLSNRFRF